MVEIDYLLVGQGIAGTILSHFLLKRNKSILVVDELNANSASTVAAGLFNPITGRRFVKTWFADNILPFAQSTYKELEQNLDGEFYFKKSLIRLFSSEQDERVVEGRLATDEFSDYLLKPTVFKNEKQGMLSAFGGVEIERAGYVDMAHLITKFRRKLLEEGNLLESPFSAYDLIFTNGFVHWKDYRAKRVIFCEGYKAIENPFFGWLPFVPTKGEIIDIYSVDLQLDKIVIKGIFILPLGGNNYRVGSTNRWDFADAKPTLEAKQELTDKLDKLLNCTYSVTNHKAGIRPTVKDRRPFLGIHPIHPEVGIFNGLGTKGASLAPYFANHFVCQLEDGTALMDEIDIKRFWKD